MSPKRTVERTATPVERQLAEVEGALAAFFQRQSALPNRGQLASLWDAALRLSSGGKYLRPRLFLTAYDALVTNPVERIPEEDLVAVAAAIELLHVSFLMHDDVIDRDLIRRGQPNVIAVAAADAEAHGVDVVAARHYGAASAILIGNAALSEVHRAFAVLDLEQKRRRTIAGLLDTVIADSITGELNDVAMSVGTLPATVELIRDTTVRKTAPYSVEFPLRLAAILADAPAEIEARLANIANSIGLAFQLQDDLLGVFAEPEEHGKARCADLSEHKQTLLLALAQQTPQWEGIAPRLGMPEYDRVDAGIVRQLLRDSGAVHAVEAEITRRLLDAELGAAALDEIGPSGAALARVLVDFITRLQGRKS